MDNTIRTANQEGIMKAHVSIKSGFITLLAILIIAAAVPAFAADNGTSLAVTVDTPTVTCNPEGTGAEVSASYTVLSTGSADSAVVVATIDGVDNALPTIASGNVAGGGGWTFAGRTKTAEGTFTTSLPNGTYFLTICATQSGAGGRNPKRACSTSVAVTINCTSPDPCGNVGPFGEVVANDNLCKANGHIEVHFRGSFGDTASLVIAGPGGFSLPVGVDRAGESCNYHYNWDPGANQAAGTYTFTVNGSLSWSADLICDAPGPDPGHGH
jgi:hypothetical protein